MTVSECCLVKMLPYIISEKYIYILALEMASPGVSTVPIASAHFLTMWPVLGGFRDRLAHVYPTEWRQISTCRINITRAINSGDKRGRPHANDRVLDAKTLARISSRNEFHERTYSRMWPTFPVAASLLRNSLLFLFFFFGIHYMDSPDCLLLFLSTSVFYFLVFLFLQLFSCRFRAVD